MCFLARREGDVKSARLGINAFERLLQLPTGVGAGDAAVVPGSVLCARLRFPGYFDRACASSPGATAHTRAL